MPEKVYGLGLLVGSQIKVIGLSPKPLSSSPPPPPILRILDEFNQGAIEARKYAREAVSVAKLCRFEAETKAACGHGWLSAEKVELVQVYENFFKKASAAA